MDYNSVVEEWRDIIILFFQTKMNQSSLAKASKYIDDKKIEFNSEVNPKKKERLLLSIESKKNELKDLKLNPSEIVDWLDKNTKTKIAIGSRIIKSTHPLKISHSSAPNDGVLIYTEDSIPLLSTASIPNRSKIFDMAHNNGALISISRFLALSYNHVSIYDLILSDEFYFLDGFSKDKKQLDLWKSGLSQLVEKRNIKSASFNKQLYFPIEKESYHLLAVLTSSTIAELIFNKIGDVKYYKRVDFFNKNGIVTQQTTIPKNKIAVVRVGGNNPQNVSMLNRGRNFKAYKDSTGSYGIYQVLSCQPPTWSSQLKPPIYKNNFFYELSKNYEVKENIQYLSDFLARFENLQLSIKAPKRMRWVEEWIENIADEALFYVKSIQALPAGWSTINDIKLKPEHQVLLDCYRQDDDFLAFKNSSNWKAVIIQDFSVWLNNSLNKLNDKFTPLDEHSHLWAKLFEENFRETLDVEKLVKKEVEL